MTNLAIILTAALALSAAAPAAARDDERQYTFAWMFADDSRMRPRGGTTEGPAVTMATAPSAAWKTLTGSEATGVERDRLAILALAGTYRTSFDFIETVGFTEGDQPRRPYQSWATEHIQVITDQPRFISLQHILVMRFIEDDGSVSEPRVMKHWRQDWRYQDRDLHVYAGHGQWRRQRLSAEQARGTWSQAVYQVGGSPRYEASGRWEHRNSHSTWTSGTTWRPLPRRESSVRDDYDVLSGINRVSITPRGWVHEQDNLKLALDENGEPASYVAREAGLVRYELITGYDFSPGEAYWERTAPYWRLARRAWREIYTERDRFSLKSEVAGRPLFQPMFEMAGRFASDPDFGLEQARAAIENTLSRYLDGPPS